MCSWPFGPFQYCLQTCDQLVNYMRLNHMRLNHTEEWTGRNWSLSLSFQHDYPFDWSHGMLPQLCLPILEEMNGFSVGSIGSIHSQYHVATFVSFLRGIWQKSNGPFCNGGARSAMGKQLCQMAASLPGSHIYDSFFYNISYRLEAIGIRLSKLP